MRKENRLTVTADGTGAMASAGAVAMVELAYLPVSARALFTLRTNHVSITSRNQGDLILVEETTALEIARFILA